MRTKRCKKMRCRQAHVMRRPHAVVRPSVRSNLIFLLRHSDCRAILPGNRNLLFGGQPQRAPDHTANL